MALGLTQPLIEMSTRHIIYCGGWGVGGLACVGLTALTHLCADCLETWEPEPPGTLRACAGIAVPLPVS